VNELDFWKLIEVVKGSDTDVHHSKRLTTRLRKLPAPEIISFDTRFRRLREAAHRGDVWAAGVLLNHGHGTDDGFEYFRNWLISRGRKTYQGALKKPDSLSSQAVRVKRFGPEAEFESFGYAAAVAYEEVIGKKIDKSKDWWERPGPVPAEEFDWQSYTDDVLVARLPKLWKRFGSYKQKADVAASRARNDYAVKAGEKVSIKGLGVLRVGAAIRHREYGVGKITSMMKCLGSAVTAQVAFTDAERPMYIDAASKLWSLPGR
jgi:hypothetical protein